MKNKKPSKAKTAKANISPAPVKRSAASAKFARTPNIASERVPVSAVKTPAPAPTAMKASAPVASAAPANKRGRRATIISPAPTPVAAAAPTPAVKAAPVKTPTPPREITADLIAVRAYILWEKQGRPQGNELANWLQAESQIKQEIQTLSA